ncbi:hypothetical protein T4D_4192 [Trichinella pseudospiralis]|uniref:Secreted protein n=1 Tax=Trichinella pseudospiralis TaxID=6337 RepID=A0A0V1F885_TRIPS|nr:hypothetical protein T4D_4192 [Trichinella pseudospiralis]
MFHLVVNVFFLWWLRIDCSSGPTNVYYQILQDSFRVREINYSKLRVKQNTRAKRLAQMCNFSIFRY